MANFTPTPEFQASVSEGTVVDPNAQALPKTCTLDQLQYNENDSIERFQFASVPNGSTCAKQFRKCRAGIFDGTYTYSTCSAQTNL